MLSVRAFWHISKFVLVGGTDIFCFGSSHGSMVMRWFLVARSTLWTCRFGIQFGPLLLEPWWVSLSILGRFEMCSSLGSGFKYSPVQLNSISCLKRWPYHHSKKFAVVMFSEGVYIFGRSDGIQVFLKPIYDLVSMICFWTGVHLNYLIVIANPIPFSWWSGSFVAGGCM
jgi:hypothetical protein